LKTSKVYLIAFALVCLVLTLGVANQYSPYKILYSPQDSIAKGFYYSSPCTALDLKTRGVMVSFSYQQEDWLPEGIVPNYKKLTKYMVGIAGDVVSVGDDFTSVCTATKCQEFKRIPEMPMNVEQGIIKEGEFFGIATAYNSFDSRYAGNFKQSAILGCLVKL